MWKINNQRKCSETLGLELAPGDSHYRAFVGPPQDYDLVSAMTFCLLAGVGLRQHHKVVDVGCGSLRLGRLLIPYLNRGGYLGVEPNEWLVKDGILHEVGKSQIELKAPRFFESGTELIEGSEEKCDFAVAQSIFSHTGVDLLRRWLSDASEFLTHNGLLLATFIEGENYEENGWVYPGCVTYQLGQMESLASEVGLEVAPLDWWHPRQKWVAIGFPSDRLGELRTADLSWNGSVERGDWS